MAKFPEPPAPSQLRAIDPDLKVVPPGILLWRIYFRDGKFPARWNDLRFYGPLSTARFDHHLEPCHEQDRGIFYAAFDYETCIAEVFQDTRVIDRKRNAPWLAGFPLGKELILLDLTGSWPTRAGASMSMNSGPRPRARRWSQAIYRTYPMVQGLYYCSSMNRNEPAVAVYERALPARPRHPAFNRALAEPDLAEIIDLCAGNLGYLVI